MADQLRMRWRSLQRICPKDEALEEMRALVGHRRDLIQDQTRRITRLRGLLLEICPALEATLNLNHEGALQAVTKVATPASIRRLGEARLARWLKSRGVRKWRVLAQRIVAAAKAQKCELPAARRSKQLSSLRSPWRCSAHQEAHRRPRRSPGGTPSLKPAGLEVREGLAGDGHGLRGRVSRRGG
jgi:hypothetical protein